MPNQNKLSRRDWFRLRVPAPQTNTLGETNHPPSQPGLKPIEQPPNHDGMDLDQLPPMREAVLSSEQVSALFADIGQLGSDIMLMQRAGSARRATAAAPDSVAELRLAETALLNSNVQRVQIRYRWQQTLWIDTLSFQPDGFRIVRIAHQER